MPSPRLARRAGLGALCAVTLILIAVSRYAVPMGLDAPRPIPPVDGIYTAQISGFVDVPPDEDRHLGLSAGSAARLVADGQVIAAVERDGSAFSDAAVPAGVRRVLIQFEQVEGGEAPVLYFGRASGRDVPVGRAALSPRRLSPAAWILRRNLERTALAVALLWMGVGAALGLRLAWGWFDRQLPATDRRAVWALLLFAVALFAHPLWWGLPTGWAEDELRPVDLSELSDIVSPGWHSKYPPMHMYVLAAVNAPILAAAGLDMLETSTAAVFPAMKIAASLVSVVMAVGITALVYLCAARAAGPRVGVLAGLIWTLTLPAVFYAKTANLDMPYTFWFAVSLLAYQSALDRQAVASYVLFAAAATLAVVTKDQAYGLFLLPALHLAVARYRRLGSARALATDRAIAGALATGVVLFAVSHNLLFNWHGFRAHVDTITGGASQAYRMVDSSSAAGQAWIALRSVQQIVWSLSWPGAILAFLGVAWGMGASATRGRLLPFVLPGVSYYLTFIAVVGYTYDRFLLPLCVILAIFAGLALDRLWPAGAPRWRTVLAAGVLVFMTLRAGSLNQLMAADGRYDVQRWMHAHIPPRTQVAFVESRALLPDLEPFPSVSLPDPLSQFDALRPPVVVISDNYRRRFPADAPEVAWLDALVGGDRGYRVALRHRASVPLAILAWERQFRDPDPSFSTLHKVNPEIMVLFRKDWPETDARREPAQR